MTQLAPASLVTPEQRLQYQTDGYMILPGVIPAEVLTMLREECSYFLGYADSSLDARGIESDGITHRGSRYFISNKHFLSKRLPDFIFSPLMAEVAQAALGPNVYLFNEQWVVKGPDVGMKFAWHQDSGYVKWADTQTQHQPYLTCWVTLDDVNEDNGTVYILPHGRGGTSETIFDHTKEEGSNDLIGYKGDDPGDPLIVPAGSIVAFSSYLFHRSGANTTPNMRRVYLPQYSHEPILRRDDSPWALTVPFVKDGEIVYEKA